MTRMLFVAAIALAQTSGNSVHAADVSAEAKAAVEKAITEMGCSRDVDDEVETNGDGYKAEYVLCEDGPYYLTFDKDYKLPARRSKTERAPPGPLGLDLCAIIVRVETPRPLGHKGRANDARQDEYRGCAIKASPMSTADGEWTHEGHIERDLRRAVDDHRFCAPGKSANRDEAVKAILAYGKRIVDERFSSLNAT